MKKTMNGSTGARFALVLPFCLLLAGSGSKTFAQTGDGSAKGGGQDLMNARAPGSPASFFPYQNTNYQMYNAQKMAGLFGACMNIQVVAEGATDAIQGWTKGVPTAPITLDSPCGDRGAIAGKEASCSSISTGPAALAAIKAMTMQNDQVIASAKCEKGKYLVVQKELECLSTYGTAGSQALGSLQESMNQNIDRWKGDVVKMNETIGHHKAQHGEIEEWLKGNGGKDRKGLIYLKNLLASGPASGAPAGGYLNKLQTDIRGYREASVALENNRKGLEEAIKSRVWVLTNECFGLETAAVKYQDADGKTAFKPMHYGQTGLTCTPGGPFVSPWEHLLCVYEQKHSVGKSGRVNRGNTRMAARGKQDVAKLESFFKQIYRVSPKVKDILYNPNAGNPQAGGGGFNNQEIMALLDDTGRIKTPEQLEANFGAQMERTFGRELKDFVMDHYRSCYDTAVLDVEAERSSQNSRVGRVQEDILRNERLLRDEVAKTTEELTQAFSEIKKELTDWNLPPDLTACDPTSKPNAPPDPKYLVTCLERAHKAMRAVLNGGSEYARTVKYLHGTDPSKEPVAIACEGLNDCIAKSGRKMTEMEKVVRNWEKYKASYVDQANRNLRGQIETWKRFAKADSGWVNTRLNKINMVIKSLSKGSKGVVVKGVPREDLEMGEDGLYKHPKSALAVIGGSIEPPWPDLSPEGLGDVDMGEGPQALERKLAEAQTANEKLKNLAKSCALEELKVASKDANRSLTKALDYGCSLFPRGDGQAQCEKDSDFTQWAQNISDVQKLGIPASDTDFSRLRGKLREACRIPPTTTGETPASKANCNGISQDARDDMDRVSSAAGNYRSVTAK